MKTPVKVMIYERRHGADDPYPFQADVLLGDGRDFHAVGATAAEALRELALYWIKKEGSSDGSGYQKAVQNDGRR